MLGHASGKLVQDIGKIKHGTYDKPENYREAFVEMMDNMSGNAQAGMTAEAIYQLPHLLKAMFTPLETTKRQLGRVREVNIGDKSLQNDTTKELLNQQMLQDKRYLGLPATSQQQSQTQLDKYFQMNSMGPNNTTTNDTLINDYYKNLSILEKNANAYGRNGTDPTQAALSQGQNLVSSLTRDYLNQQIPKLSQFSNRGMSKISQLQPKLHSLVKWGAGSAAGIMGLRKLFEGFKGE
jgi:hypothetical protein